jgi:hypothetical protein
MHPHIRLPLLLGILLHATACQTTPPPLRSPTPEYTLHRHSHARPEPNKTGEYDPTLGGYWLDGPTGVIRLDPRTPTPPTHDLILSIRTPRLRQLRLLTPQHTILVQNHDNTLNITNQEGHAHHTQILDATGLVRITPDGPRVKIQLNNTFLQHYAPDGVVLAWFNE